MAPSHLYRLGMAYNDIIHIAHTNLVLGLTAVTAKHCFAVIKSLGPSHNDENPSEWCYHGDKPLS